MIAHHFSQAGLDDLAIDWRGKAGDQALRRSAFQEAISHLGKAIAIADRAGATQTRATTGLDAPHQGLTPSRVAYGNELLQRAVTRPGNDGSVCQGARVGVCRQGRARAVVARLWLMDEQRHARRVDIDAGARRGLPQRRRGEPGFARGRRRPSRCRNTCWFACEYAQARDHLDVRSPRPARL